MLKSLILKFLSESDLRTELVKRNFIVPSEIDDFRTEEIEEMWKKIFNQFPLLLKWIKFRKNQLLNFLLTTDEDRAKNILRGALSEWELIERFSQNVSNYPFEMKQNYVEEEKNIEEIKEKLKRVVINK